MQFQANDNKELQIELTNATGTYLHHINDYCLLEIFASQSFTLMDLCCLAETCSRFKEITGRVFPKGLSIKYCRAEDYKIKSKKYSRSRGHREQDIERIFKNFGSFIQAISLSSFSVRCEYKTYFVLNLVGRHCVDNLRSLTIDNMKINEVVAAKLKPIFKQLQLLDLMFVVIMCDKTLFEGLDSLVELRLYDAGDCRTILENTFPKLKHFRFYQDYFFINKFLINFVARHTGLKTLHLDTNLDAREILKVIGNSCKDLMKLSIEMVSTRTSSLLPLGALKQLETLELQHASLNNLKFMPTLTNLRELHLDCCYPPKDLNQIAFLAHITKLRIFQGFMYGSFDIVDLIRQLINLEELTIQNRFVLEEETFFKVVRLVKGRPNVLVLKCKFNFSVNLKICGKVHLDHFEESL